MNLPLRLSAILFSSALLCGAAHANVTLAPLFTDHAVLQRDKPLPLWGHAEPGARVSVLFHGQRTDVTAGADGKWMAWLPPAAADAKGADLTVSSGNTVVLHDVVVGEVWICSGQSNMEFSVGGHRLGLLRARQEIAEANHPLIRHFKVKTQEADVPIDTASGNWEVCSPQTVPGFTAVGYFFARHLERKLQVPIGLVNSTWGGTAVESWLSAAALAGDPEYAAVESRWKTGLAAFPQKKAALESKLAAWTTADAAARSKGQASEEAYAYLHPKPGLPYERVGGPGTPSGLFNGMIEPLIPYAFRGVIWYQGEANVFRPSEYHPLFADMIADWRRQFGQGDFPFYWVQLPNYEEGEPYEDSDPTHMTRAFLREAQSEALNLPNTGQAVTIDIGDPVNNHPADKQDVGRRLALIAEAKVYGITVDWSGPVFASAAREGSAMRVRFKFADNGLTASGSPPQSFELAGADRRFHPATAEIAGSTVLVRSPEVPAPVAVRYAWHNNPGANLYNGAGLPAAPFRSDSW